MLRIYFLDSACADDSHMTDLCRSFPAPFKDYLGGAVKKRRLFAYSALLSIIGIEYASEFYLGEHGAPIFKGGPPFSISYSGDAICIAVCDGGRVGVDIELISDERLSEYERLGERFGAAKKITAKKLLKRDTGYILEAFDRDETVEFFTVEYKSGSFIKTYIYPDVDNECGPLDFWVKTEAVLKMSGEGFCAYPNLCGIGREAAVVCFGISLGQKDQTFAFSVCRGESLADDR